MVTNYNWVIKKKKPKKKNIYNVVSFTQFVFKSSKKLAPIIAKGARLKAKYPLFLFAERIKIPTPKTKEKSIFLYDVCIFKSFLFKLVINETNNNNEIDVKMARAKFWYTFSK